jgi:hypothetical protein
MCMARHPCPLTETDVLAAAGGRFRFTLALRQQPTGRERHAGLAGRGKPPPGIKSARKLRQQPSSWSYS